MTFAPPFQECFQSPSFFASPVRVRVIADSIDLLSVGVRTVFPSVAGWEVPSPPVVACDVSNPVFVLVF